MKSSDKNIILTGFMGSGKTFTSKALSRLLKRPMFSTDARIVEREGRSIADIFKTDGEAHFRDLERQAVGEAAGLQGHIIDCGGGVVKDQGNIDALKANGIVFYLKTSPEWVLKRTRDLTKRPLLNVDDPLAQIERLLAERAPMYEQADVTVDTDGKTPEVVAAEIIDLLKIHNSP